MSANETTIYALEQTKWTNILIRKYTTCTFDQTIKYKKDILKPLIKYDKLW